MLRVTVELVPHGDETKKRQIAVMDLWNTVSSGGWVDGNYKAVAKMDPSPWFRKGLEAEGEVLGHPRHLPVWTLVGKMLKAMGYEA